MKLRVVRATVYEWPAIESLRRMYFEPRQQAVQRRGDDVAWYIAMDEKERVVGCYSYSDAIAFGQRWVLDFYVVAGKAGRAAAKAMGEHIGLASTDSGLDVAGTIAPDNTAFYNALASYDFQPVGIIMLRARGGTWTRRRDRRAIRI